MNIESLELDTDTQNAVLAALEHSGLSLAEFIQKACTVYAKTVVGKANQVNEYKDISDIPTSEHMSNKKFKTYPGRAEELVKRAIRAIHKYNSMCVSEDNERWYISLSSIQSLTGCNAQKIAEIGSKFEVAIADANASFPDVTPYSNKNRKVKGTKIGNFVRLAKLIPNGIE